MLKQFVRLLPYWIMMWCVRNTCSADGAGKLIIKEEYDIKYYQFSEGEFVIFSTEFQARFDEIKKKCWIKQPPCLKRQGIIQFLFFYVVLGCGMVSGFCVGSYIRHVYI